MIAEPSYKSESSISSKIISIDELKEEKETSNKRVSALEKQKQHIEEQSPESKLKALILFLGTDEDSFREDMTHLLGYLRNIENVPQNYQGKLQEYTEEERQQFIQIIENNHLNQKTSNEAFGFLNSHTRSIDESIEKEQIRCEKYEAALTLFNADHFKQLFPNLKDIKIYDIENTSANQNCLGFTLGKAENIPTNHQSEKSIRKLFGECGFKECRKPDLLNKNTTYATVYIGQMFDPNTGALYPFNRMSSQSINPQGRPVTSNQESVLVHASKQYKQGLEEHLHKLGEGFVLIAKPEEASGGMFGKPNLWFERKD